MEKRETEKDVKGRKTRGGMIDREERSCTLGQAIAFTREKEIRVESNHFSGGSACRVVNSH
jgi:hypothetical protein